MKARSGSTTTTRARRPRALKLAYLNSHFQASFDEPARHGDPRRHPAPADLATYSKLAEFPYDFTRRLLSVVVQQEDGPPSSSPRALPRPCRALSHVREDHTARPIGAAEHARLAKLVDGASADGFRLVAVGSRALAPRSSVGPIAAAGTPEPDRRRPPRARAHFEGVILFSDPPKAGVGDDDRRARPPGRLPQGRHRRQRARRAPRRRTGRAGRRGRPDRRGDAQADPPGAGGAGEAARRSSPASTRTRSSR